MLLLVPLHFNYALQVHNRKLNGLARHSAMGRQASSNVACNMHTIHIDINIVFRNVLRTYLHIILVS